MTVTAADYEALAAIEPAFARAIERQGIPETFGSAGPLNADERFAALARAVIDQQLSTKAAATIHGRVVALVGGTLTPRGVLARDETELRLAGMSGAKIRSLHGIARAVIDEAIDLVGLDASSDDDAVAELVALPGVGPWTAQVFLMFVLGRSDVLAAGDVGVLAGITTIFGLPERPTPKQLIAMAEPWRPHRTAACLLAWNASEAAPLSPGG